MEEELRGLAGLDAAHGAATMTSGVFGIFGHEPEGQGRSEGPLGEGQDKPSLLKALSSRRRTSLPSELAEEGSSKGPGSAGRGAASGRGGK